MTWKYTNTDNKHLSQKYIELLSFLISSNIFFEIGQFWNLLSGQFSGVALYLQLRDKFSLQ